MSLRVLTEYFAAMKGLQKVGPYLFVYKVTDILYYGTHIDNLSILDVLPM